MEYKRVKMMNDERWTNAIKCDIMKTFTDLLEVQNNNRQEGLDVILDEEKQYLHELKSNVKKNRLIMKEGITDFKEKMLSKTNRKLLERYRYTHPDEIKSSIKRSIHQINYGANILITQINQKKSELRKLNNSYEFQHKKTINYGNFKGIMRNLTNIDDKIRLANFKKRKMKNMVNLAQQNLNKYDSLLEQLHNDQEEMATNIMNEIEIVVQFERETNNYTQQLKNEILASQKQRIKQVGKIEQLNFMSDSMDRSRKTLMNERPTTDFEVAFQLSLPWATEDPIPDSKINTISNLSDENNDWYKKMLTLGVNYLINEDEQNRILTKLENENNISTIKYKFPADIKDYILYYNDISQKNDDIALNYLLKNLKFNTIEDLIHFIERTKHDLIKLNAFKVMRETLWKLIIKENVHLQEATENCNLMTNNDTEFFKQEKSLNYFIDGQRKKISELEESKNHYIKLFNDMCFYMDNLRSILQKLNFSGVYIKTGNNAIEKKLDIPDLKLAQLIKEANSLVSQIDVKIRCCTAMFSSNYTNEQMNIARAVYIFKVQKHIQEQVLKEQIMLKKKKLKNPKDIPMPPKVILSREETKKRADRVLKYIAEKDTDKSKNKRKPISFRKSFI